MCRSEDKGNSWRIFCFQLEVSVRRLPDTWLAHAYLVDSASCLDLKIRTADNEGQSDSVKESARLAGLRAS